MIKTGICLFFFFLSAIFECKGEENSWIRVNQLGYRNEDIKVAVLLSREFLEVKSFEAIDVK
jgi:endoglucanase